MALRRLKRRPIRRVCLDLLHDDPDQPCPYCAPDPDAEAITGQALRLHAQLAAEEADAWGWAA